MNSVWLAILSFQPQGFPAKTEKPSCKWEWTFSSQSVPSQAFFRDIRKVPIMCVSVSVSSPLRNLMSRHLSREPSLHLKKFLLSPFLLTSKCTSFLLLFSPYVWYICIVSLFLKRIHLFNLSICLPIEEQMNLSFHFFWKDDESSKSNHYNSISGWSHYR